MGAAAGIDKDWLKRFAGAYQILSGTSSLSFYWSNFDDPEDQKYIQGGINWYDKYYDKDN